MKEVSTKPARRLRCAIYTRKSSEEGLEQEFNSLHAQREACEAFIASQKSEAGRWYAISMMMAAYLAAPWNALPCNNCLPISRTAWSTWLLSTRSTACRAR